MRKRKILILFLNVLLIFTFSFIGCSKSTIPSISKTKSIEELTPTKAKNILKKYNIEFNVQNYFSMIKSNDIKKVKLFLKAGMNVNTKYLDSSDKNNYGKNGLMVAVGLGHKDVALTLIKNGIDINAIDNNSRNALWTAVDNSKSEMIKLLADNKIDVNYIDPTQNDNILYYAVTKNNVNAVKELLNTKVNVHYLLDNFTILHCAASYPSTDKEIFKMLKDKGVDINAKDKAGMTPLEMAIALNRSNNVMALIELGADKTIKNNQGIDAIELAKRMGNNEIISLLEK